MDLSTLCLPLEHNAQREYELCYCKSSTFQEKINIPKEFIWPEEDLVHADEELKEPVVDLERFFRGDCMAKQHAAYLVRAACLSHGFFQVINHGVDSHLISMAYDHANSFFKLPIGEKLKAKKQPGTIWGYSNAHSDRFSSKLPWKETLSFGFPEEGSSAVGDFFESIFGKTSQQTGLVFQKYCEAMKRLSLAIMEILGISLGVDGSYYKEYFQDSSSIMRCNFYPPCKQPELTLGTGPHCDPTALTILHQDEVGGLEVFVNNKWKAVRPRRDAFVINIGDTFMALSNGKYKSCLHRAVVNRYNERTSLAFFVCPQEEKVITPPKDLVSRDGVRKYPDFTWSDLLEFMQKHHRADDATLQNFTKWLVASK